MSTERAASKLQLNNGVRLQLGSESRVRVYEGRAVLEKGVGQLTASAAYPVEARTLHISSAEPNTVARVQLDGATGVVVSTVSGAVRVTNATGILIANLGAGRAASFDPQAGAAAPTKVSGCLLKKDGKFIIVDTTTNVTMELQGGVLEKELGNHVEVTGVAASSATTVSGASQLIYVSSMKRISKGSCASVAKAVGAAGAVGAAAGAAAASAAGAGAATGMGVAATAAIVGGVAVAGTAGGLAASGTFSGSSATSSASR